MRLLLALVGLTIGFVVPAFAQEKEEVNPKILAGIQANDKAFDDAFNKRDPAAIAALYSENAVLVVRGGGSEADSTPAPVYYLLSEDRQGRIANHIRLTAPTTALDPIGRNSLAGIAPNHAIPSIRR